MCVFSAFSSVNSLGQRVELSLDLDPPICSIPVGTFQILSGGSVQSFSLHTANIDAERARTLVSRVALLDRDSLARFLDRVKSGCSHALDLDEFVREAGLASKDPMIQGVFRKWDDAEKARMQFFELQAAVSDLIRYQQDQKKIAAWTFDWEKDKVYFAYAEAPRSMIYPEAPLVKALRQTEGAGMWLSPYNALACPSHPRHELTRQVLQDIVNDKPYLEGAPNWKLYDDLYYLYHHGDLPDALLDSLSLKGRAPRQHPKINFSLLEKEMPFSHSFLCSAPSA